MMLEDDLPIYYDIKQKVQQNLKFERLDPVKTGHFCLINDLNKLIIINRLIDSEH